MKNYVVGFLFSTDLRYVILIKKNRPDWQKGLLNGVGGKIEPNEDPHDAMRREFKEETGVNIPLWNPVCVLDSTKSEHKVKTDWRVHFYTASAHYNVLYYDCVTTTDEQTYFVDIGNINLYPPTVDNLKWLIPMAKETLRKGSSYYIAENTYESMAE